ncbi:alpha/beta fold hydrolase [Actinosynnema sp. NPDC059335]|uniref:alpha/beta fold hydrolase n=1 Tax=Actinosynnema sp. NPDC059335 TaxID=3346804 RepID=UPI0036717FDF
MVVEFDVRVGGRTLRAYDTGAGEFPVFWHHGTPNVGAPPAPLFDTAARLGIRWLSYDRPGYGGSTPDPGRDVASAAACVTAVADALGVERFGVFGHSGGGPHALACAALLPHRVLGVVSGAGLAPFDAPDLDWFGGMAASGVASLRAAAAGRAAKERFEASGVEYDPEFTPADLDALAGDWAWFGDVVGPAVAAGPGGLIDDDLAYVNPWGFDPADVTAPVLLLHGGRDRVVPASHAGWLARRSPSAELRLSEEDGHISVLRAAPSALDWLRAKG